MNKFLLQPQITIAKKKKTKNFVVQHKSHETDESQIYRWGLYQQDFHEQINKHEVVEKQIP